MVDAQTAKDTAKAATDALPVITANPMAALVLFAVFATIAVVVVCIYVIRYQHKNNDRMHDALAKATGAQEITSRAAEGLVRPTNEILAMVSAVRSDVAIIRERGTERKMS